MTLVEQLRAILPDLLPTDPKDAIYGKELVEKVREQLSGTYADASLRWTFSHLAADPTSPIARVEQGYGYYRRPVPDQQPVVVAEVQPAEPAAAVPAPATGRGDQPEEKFRAFFIRHARLVDRYPVAIDHVTAQRQRAGVNKWKFPDVVVLDWDIGEATDAGFALDKALLEVKRGLGEQPFRLTSVELKVELTLSTFREYFFQCVSNSMWAHSATLVVAKPVSDALLANELRRLGASYGVAVQSFGLTDEVLATMPSASAIAAMGQDDFERLASNVAVTPVSPGSTRAALDWEHIRDMKTQSSEFVDLFEWVARCLRDSKAYTFEHFLSLRQIEQEAG
jgi:hypothetical protein